MSEAVVTPMKRVKYTRPVMPEGARDAEYVLDQLPSELPKNYRNVAAFDFGEDAERFRAHQLHSLSLSGSAQFTPPSIKFIAEGAKGKPLVVFDLRQESHLFVNDHAVTVHKIRDWGNVGRNSAFVIQDELTRAAEVLEVKPLPLFEEVDMVDQPHRSVPQIMPEATSVEQHVVESAGARYIRLCITDHARPADVMVWIRQPQATGRTELTWDV
jgi:hypothetical protein